MADQESGMGHENTTARTDTDSNPGVVAEAGAQAPTLRVRARRSAVRVLLRRGAFASAIALAALVVSYHYGGFLGTGKHQALPEILAIAGAVVFLLSAVIAVRCATNDVLGLVHAPGRLSDARASTLRLLCLLVGYALVIFGALSLLHVPVGRLLLGGVLTGVIVGIAAQQVLGNLFAGLMLLFARPFTIGDKLTIRSGALGGPVIGRVAGMTMTYVTVTTAAGPVLLPNSAVLAAAVGPATEWSEP
jgi:small-conductance mechanosensitive channel